MEPLGVEHVIKWTHIDTLIDLQSQKSDYDIQTTRNSTALYLADPPAVASAPGWGVSLSGSVGINRFHSTNINPYKFSTVPARLLIPRALDRVGRECLALESPAGKGWTDAIIPYPSYDSLPSLQSLDDYRHEWMFNNFSGR